MDKKQFYLLLGTVTILVAGVLYFIFFEPMVARSECADWALTRTKALIPESFVEDSNDTLPIGPSDESVSKVQAMYDLHYSVCMQKGGYGN